MEQWQDSASQQVKLLTNHLNGLLSKGLGLLRSELGVDLGLKPELIPPWVILLAACTGLVLMVALWASVCRAVFKKRGAARPEDDGVELKRTASKPVKSEEPKKKKKKVEKAPKTQSNGRAVAEPQEEAKVSEELVPHHQPPPSEVKAEKIPEGKKTKKKAKQAAKETKSAAVDGKEPEEGTWETKVSNKEKREQRKKDKSSSDGSASPGGGDTPVGTPSEQPKAAAAPTPANQKKKKGESAKVKAEKAEVVLPQVVTNSKAAAVSACAPEVPIKAPAHNVPTKTEPWKANREGETLWGGDIDESWTVIEPGMPTTERKLVTFAGLNAEPVRDLPWLSQPRVDDEWSGLNGNSVDPSSDWNAPAEVWGNYEEPTSAPPPTQQQLLPEPTRVNLLAGVADDDEDDKGETVGDAAAKKKKKKKKKKAAEEAAAAGQADGPGKEAPPAPTKKQPVQEKPTTVPPVKAAAVEPKVEKPVKDNISQKPPVTQVPQKPTDVEPTAKQNSVSAPTQQKKPEDNQAPKPAKKKKARRET
ncbi:protein LYRIC-like isoform X1 [Takifugu flavidus]|uniref:protein LYRIC-like isoform X1 n=1 Tax=Takifugu flavidus TaxID=433684 RepID=UPI0025440644|nr:protein LYRIC-like isoform X1 [Takifugu flavidus]